MSEILFKRYMEKEVGNKMRESQKTIFWRDHRVVEIRRKGKVFGWYGKKFPKTAEEIINEKK